MLLKRRVIAFGAAVALLMIALVGAAAAQDEPAAPNAKTVAVEVAGDGFADKDHEADLDDPFFEDDCEFEDWEPTAEELAEINAETEAMAEYLRGQGFEVTVETDELGFSYVDFESEDEALFAAMDDFYRQLFADEVAGWSDEEKAEWNAEINELVAELEADGITVETEEIAPGVYDIVWTEELEQALWEFEDDDECWFEGEIAELEEV
jgi:hypothetical protein